jgi:hypothetical protein
MTLERRRRETAAEAYRPPHIRLLLVAEAPPADPARYFYFEGRDSIDPLFEGVCYVLFEEATPGDKAPRLKALRRRGVFVTELGPDGTGAHADLVKLAEWLPLRVETLAPDHVVLIGARVARAALAGLQAAKLPVVDGAVPAPDGTHRADFARELRAALVRAGLEKLIKPLPAPKSGG